ncbi:MAG: hypothetical protein ACXW3M_13760, partial [Rhodoplanes sp.]
LLDRLEDHLHAEIGFAPSKLAGSSPLYFFFHASTNALFAGVSSVEEKLTMPQMPLEVAPSVLTLLSVTTLTPATNTLPSTPNSFAWVAKLMALRPASATHRPSAPDDLIY